MNIILSVCQVTWEQGEAPRCQGSTEDWVYWYLLVQCHLRLPRNISEIRLKVTWLVELFWLFWLCSPPLSCAIWVVSMLDSELVKIGRELWHDKSRKGYASFFCEPCLKSPFWEQGWKYPRLGSHRMPSIMQQQNLLKCCDAEQFFCYSSHPKSHT